MKKIVLTATLMAVTAVQAAAAGPYDGTYVFLQPGKEVSGQCADQGFPNVWFTDDRYDINGEFECVLTNPVAVRDMNASLYDVTCRGFESRGPFRELILETVYGINLIENLGVLELVKCE